VRAFWPELMPATKLFRGGRGWCEPAVAHLTGTSPRFRRLIDAQLRQFAQCDATSCPWGYAAVLLALGRKGLHAIEGGAGALADRLAESIAKSGGVVRLNTTALRLAYNDRGAATGVDLLSGETVTASRAVISNLTIWDTYSKLTGPGRVPDAMRKQLAQLSSWGAYLIYLGIDEAAADRLPASQIIAINKNEAQADDAGAAQLALAVAPSWNTRGPAGKRAATLHLFTDVDQWFTFHQDESEHEAQDQALLESVWARLHAALPELGDGAEVIETATPRTIYETTRRKLGMVGGLQSWPRELDSVFFRHRSPIPNLYLVGDTTFPGAGVAAVSHSALIVANMIARN